MKKIFLIILCIVASSFVFAQETTTPKPAAVVKKKKSPAKDRALIGFSWDNWIQGKNYPVKVNPIASKGVDIAFLYDMPFGSSPISVALGLGFSSHNIHSNG